jgi:hypothetical protein
MNVHLQGEEGALSLTTKERAPDAVVKGRPLNYVAGFRPQQTPSSGISNPEGLANNLFTCTSSFITVQCSMH